MPENQKMPPIKYVCMAKNGQCSSPTGRFYACEHCTAKVCNDCRALQQPGRLDMIQ
jgi:hypothetical protein